MKKKSMSSLVSITGCNKLALGLFVGFAFRHVCTLDVTNVDSLIYITILVCSAGASLSNNNKYSLLQLNCLCFNYSIFTTMACLDSSVKTLV